MLNLLIQAVFDRAAVAVWEDSSAAWPARKGKHVGQAVSLEWQAKRDELQVLLPKIEQALKKAGAGWGDIGKIVIVTGVGNFSATRISVTIANMLSLATGAEIYELKLDQEIPVEQLLKATQQGLEHGRVPGGRGPGKEWRSVKLARPVYRHAPTITPSRRLLHLPTAVRGAGKQPKKLH
jgi:hypothetical protein